MVARRPAAGNAREGQDVTVASRCGTTYSGVMRHARSGQNPVLYLARVVEHMPAGPAHEVARRPGTLHVDRVGQRITGRGRAERRQRVFSSLSDDGRPVALVGAERAAAQLT